MAIRIDTTYGQLAQFPKGCLKPETSLAEMESDANYHPRQKSPDHQRTYREFSRFRARARQFPTYRSAPADAQLPCTDGNGCL
jgi:hypothetical protein